MHLAGLGQIVTFVAKRRKKFAISPKPQMQALYIPSRAMGIVKRSAYVEDCLDELDAQWEPLTDKEFKQLYKSINEYINDQSLVSLKGEVFENLSGKLPFTGYIISAPKNDHLLSIYNCGVDETTFGYRVINLQYLGRYALDKVPSAMVFTDNNITFVCRLNYPWREITEEIFLENHV